MLDSAPSEWDDLGLIAAISKADGRRYHQFSRNFRGSGVA
jgi:hypothetical protein